jgi:hypothetical protein
MSDIPETEGIANQTYKAFRIIQKIKRDPAMKKSHCLLRISLATHGIPSRKVGVARAYVARAMEYGMDAAFVDVTPHYGESPADPTLLKLVDAYVQMDGTPPKADVARELMSKLGAKGKKSK